MKKIFKKQSVYVQIFYMLQWKLDIKRSDITKYLI